MGIKQWFIEWITGIGELIFKFTKTTAAKIIKEYEDDILAIIVEASRQDMPGSEKFAWAVSRLTAMLPEVALYTAQTAVQVVYAIWKEEQEKIDTDGDGVPDYKDLCREVGPPPGGCVTEDGCPDADCDGVADADDPDPENPEIR